MANPHRITRLVQNRLRAQVQQFKFRRVQRIAQFIFTGIAHMVALVFEFHRRAAAQKFIQIRHWLPPRA